MLNKKIQTSILILLLIVFTACGGGSAQDIASVTKIISNHDTLASFPTGTLNLTSTISYYEDISETISELEDDPESFGYEASEVPDFLAVRVIADYLLEQLNDVSPEGDSPTIRAMYIGSGSTNITGIFIYEFPNPVSLTPETINAANNVAYDLGEHFIVSGNYLITMEDGFLIGNNIDVDILFSFIPSVIEQV